MKLKCKPTTLPSVPIIYATWNMSMSVQKHEFESHWGHVHPLFYLLFFNVSFLHSKCQD